MHLQILKTLDISLKSAQESSTKFYLNVALNLHLNLHPHSPNDTVAQCFYSSLQSSPLWDRTTEHAPAPGRSSLARARARAWQEGEEQSRGRGKENSGP